MSKYENFNHQSTKYKLKKYLAIPWTKDAMFKGWPKIDYFFYFQPPIFLFFCTKDETKEVSERVNFLNWEKQKVDSLKKVFWSSTSIRTGLWDVTKKNFYLLKIPMFTLNCSWEVAKDFCNTFFCLPLYFKDSLETLKNT